MASRIEWLLSAAFCFSYMKRHKTCLIGDMYKNIMSTILTDQRRAFFFSTARPWEPESCTAIDVCDHNKQENILVVGSLFFRGEHSRRNVADSIFTGSLFYVKKEPIFFKRFRWASDARCCCCFSRVRSERGDSITRDRLANGMIAVRSGNQWLVMAQ